MLLFAPAHMIPRLGGGPDFQLQLSAPIYLS